jgi:hypothetical protein
VLWHLRDVRSYQVLIEIKPWPGGLPRHSAHSEFYPSRVRSKAVRRSAFERRYSSIGDIFNLWYAMHNSIKGTSPSKGRLTTDGGRSLLA